MTSYAPGSPESSDHPERVVSTQPDTNLPVVRYRVLLHERRPPTSTTTSTSGTTPARPDIDIDIDIDESCGDTVEPGRGRVRRWITTNLAGDAPMTAPMTALALMVVVCYSAIMAATVGTAAAVIVVALGAVVVATLYLAGRE